MVSRVRLCPGLPSMREMFGALMPTLAASCVWLKPFCWRSVASWRPTRSAFSSSSTSAFISGSPICFWKYRSQFVAFLTSRPPSLSGRQPLSRRSRSRVREREPQPPLGQYTDHGPDLGPPPPVARVEDVPDRAAGVAVLVKLNGPCRGHGLGPSPVHDTLCGNSVKVAPSAAPPRPATPAPSGPDVPPRTKGNNAAGRIHLRADCASPCVGG